MKSLSEATPRGSRLVTLRHLEELTQADLASRLAVSQSFVSQVEKESKPLPLEVARQACIEFDVPEAFFTVPPDMSDLGVATFRKSSKASVRDEHHVKALFGEAARLFRLASESSNYRQVDLAALALVDEEEAAAAIRALLGLHPHDPIPNVTRALERLGAGVIHALAPLDRSLLDHDGISRPHLANDRPLVATVSDQPPAVTRLTLMHELGHLIYDRTLTTPIRSTRSPEERRAYRFAGAMLVPAAVVRKRITESLTLHGYLRVKADYGVSVSALIKRASDLRVISPDRARSLYIQHSSQGWRTSEPVEVAQESPRLLSQAVRRGLGGNTAVVATRSGVKESFIAHWTDLSSLPAAEAQVIPIGRRAVAP
ncbi:XRE family transcriptional regulator [Knoellia subterranea]|uniref:HTH cro/C1-type domain-containing protein n=1 Tax=Knoellia subterranea KCTC 19937 TaxID=1385521 RepID=A0A0A0JMI2_9MICO|nr:XRE family transcriptional regulator [Knoellia subterranea]KGN37277.1 hypothetical protein N803_14525 [Knoellia subterranea KCTC 19937]